MQSNQGPKESTSNLIEKRWGSEEPLFADPGGQYDIKRIVLKLEQCTSLHVHEHKREWLYVVQGVLQIDIEGKGSVVLYGEDHIYLEPKVPHRMTALGMCAAVYIEVSQCGCREDATRVKL